MLIKRTGPGEVRSSEITPEAVYAERRRFMAAGAVGALNLGLGGLASGAVWGLSGCKARAGGGEEGARAAGESAQRSRQGGQGQKGQGEGQAGSGLAELKPLTKSPFSVDEPLTPYRDVTTYNNFYEFGLGKDDPARHAHQLKTRPWTVTVDGEVKKPRVVDMDDLLKGHPLEERVYRFRCVEAWSMVIPWVGFPLGALLAELEPTSRAKFVAFQTKHAPHEMPGQNKSFLDWPYVEGLRMDEAMHPLTLLTVGLYGRVLPNQNGAPVRLVVPWKYGFKSIKSVVKITLVEKQPPTSWNLSAPKEYGFYSNVNPEVDHPRWSQKRERRIGEFARRETLMFNGYADAVAHLYKGMNLRTDY